MIKRIYATAFAIFVGLAISSTVTMADEFRVESKVYNSDKAPPVSESLTLFHDGRVYDSLSSPPEITIFDLAKKRFVLLDPTRKIRTEIGTEQLTEFIEKVRTRASNQADPLLIFAANPKFDEAVEKDGRLSFTSPHMTYRIRGSQPAVGANVQPYCEFADWSARLSTLSRQGAQPPGPRLLINAALASHGLVPDEVERSVGDPLRIKADPTVLRSTHKFEMQLYPADLKRIEEADKYAQNFQFVRIDQYLPSPKQAQR